MAIYEINSDHINKIAETTFSTVGLQERQDLQRLLREQIEIIAPDTLVIAEEFGEWEESRRRIDLLGLDKDANLVVIELKRTEDGGHMELQALRYAAMVSAMTFDKAVSVYGEYLSKAGRDVNAREAILQFLEWEEPDEDGFAQDVRIVLAAADFSKELTTAVMWLNERDLEIRCIRIKPYDDHGRVLIDVQQVIPLPEAEAYIIQIREKQQKERMKRKGGRDTTRFDVTIDGDTCKDQSKREAIYLVVKHLCASGVTPEEIIDAAALKYGAFFRSVDGLHKKREFIARLREEETRGGRRFDDKRYFCEEEDLIACQGRTYALTNQWGKRTVAFIQNISCAFPERKIRCVPSDTGE